MFLKFIHAILSNINLAHFHQYQNRSIMLGNHQELYRRLYQFLSQENLFQYRDFQIWNVLGNKFKVGQHDVLHVESKTPHLPHFQLQHQFN